jgi:6-phosphogluconolactonase
MKKRCSRPLIVVLSILSLAFAASPYLARQQKKEEPGISYMVYVGTYTVRDSKGIYAYRFQSGRLTPVGATGLVAETPNPSFLAADPSHRFLYAVNESVPGEKNGMVSAFSIDRKTGKLTFLNQVSSGGAGPCAVSLDQTGKYVLIANYDSGSVAAFPVLRGGRLGEASAFVQHSGHSINLERQEGPHAHDILASPDNRFVLTADLGLDQLLVYRFNATKGSLTANLPPAASVSAGSGPRHFVFDETGKFVYVVNEMHSTVTAFAYDAKQGKLDELQTVSALRKNTNPESTTAAEIALGASGRYLYTSNRGEDTITVFAIDPVKHTLKAVQHAPTLGKTPRGFGIDPTGSYLVAGNQDTDNMFVFRIHSKSGQLTATGKVVEVPSPVCVVFVPEE